ncbi:MAG: hypothetical protein SPL62_09045, partial [Selenomonas sp.]|nr:hypothetical protein [Selenomonas sp.]
MKKICQVFFVLLMFLVCSSSVGSAEHWISMTNPVNGAQGFFDGDSAWFDSISRDGGVNIKTQTSHMKNMSFSHNHTALSNKHYQAADFCSALRIYSGSL